MRRNLALLVVSLSLLVGLLAIFINFTEIDIFLREALRAFIPQEWQDALRPFRAPMVIGFSPDWEATDVPLRSSISITFLTPMYASLTDQSVYIEPAVHGQFSWSGRTLVFSPTEDWPMQTRVSVTVTREARSWLLRRMERGFTFHFTTVGPPLVVETDPAQDAKYTTYQRERLTITFDKPMDPRSVEKRLSISPEIAGESLSWRDQQLIISGVLRPSTEYQIVIREGARDSVHGMGTLADFEWIFTTTEQQPYLDITGIGGETVVSAGAPAELKAQVLNVSRVDLDLYGIDVSSYISMTNFLQQDWRRLEMEEDPLRSWSLDTHVPPDRREQRSIEPGELEPGLYLLRARSPEGAEDNQILVSTKTALALKWTPRQLLVWATSLDDGRPMADVSLTAYDGAGNVIATGVTDEHGVFTADIPESVGRLHVLAQRGDDMSLCSDGWREGIEPWRFEEVLWRWESRADRYKLVLYTDRFLYRPGQRVYFKGILRLDEDGEYSLPAVGTPVAVTVEGHGGNVLYERTLETNSFGTTNDDLLLSDEVGPGDYFIKAVVNDEQYQTSFRVEAYEEPGFTVSVDVDRNEYMNGDAIVASVSASYHFGVPMAEAAVSYTLYSREYVFPWRDGSDGYEQVGPPVGGPDHGHEVARGEGITDEAGNLELALRADITREDTSQLFTLEATATDASGHQASGSEVFLVHRGEFYVRLKPERYVLSAGQRAVVDVQTLDMEGDPSGHRDLTYALYLVEWQKVQRGEQARAYWDWQEVISEVEMRGFTTDGSGRERITFVPRRGGTYRLRVQGRDDRGNRVLQMLNLWVSDVERRVEWRYEVHDRIRLITDQHSYLPGDIARILVQSPYDRATALVTIERSQLVDYEVVEMEGNSGVVEITVKAEYSPNVYVSVLLAPRDGSGDELPGFKIGYAELEVESTGKDLRIDLTPDREEYRPRQMATYTIRTRDHLNRPVSAEVSLAVLDASADALGEGSVAEAVSAFHGRRPLTVRTAHSLSVHVDRQRPVEDYGASESFSEREPEQPFADLVYWNPAVVTDENGVARVRFQFPDRLATWRALADGITLDGLVGAAVEDVVTNKDLALSPLLPHFLHSGDKAVIGAIVENRSDDTLEVRVSLTADSILLPADSSRTVEITQGHTAHVYWAVEASHGASATITMIADAPGMRDIAQHTLPILPFGEQRAVLEATTVDEEQLYRVVSLPPGAQAPSLEIDLSYSVAGALLDSLDYLSAYAYGCVEQTMSRFLPHVVVSELLEGTDVGEHELSSNLHRTVESGLQQLYRLQHYDGGWGWCGADESNPYHTACVVYGLTRVRGAGYDVNEQVLRRGVGFLQRSLLETRDLDLRAYISDVLAEYGEGDLSLARSLSERRRRMAVNAQAHLALALDALGDSAAAESIVDDLAAEALETAHTAHWQEEAHDLATMSSDGRTTALVLRAMLAVDPGHPLIPKTVRWLMWTRLGGHWGTTLETAEIIVALVDFLAAGAGGDADLSYQVFVNDQVVAEDEVTVDNMAEHREVTIVDLLPGENEIRVVRDGAGELYVTTSLRYCEQRDRLEPVRSLDGPVVHRQYEDLESGEPLTNCEVGDLIRVRLRVESPQEMWYVVLEDPLPAGTEAVAGTVSTAPIGETEGRRYWTHPDLRDEKSVFFTRHLWEGVHEYTYLIRATTAGTFRVMPAEVRLMYEPDVWGRSESAVVRIEG